MPSKILFVANIHKHFKAFHIPYIQYLQNLGYEVHVAANDGGTVIKEADKQYNLPISRNPFSWDNVKTIFLLKKLITQQQYCLIHCHTAMGSVVARLAGREARQQGKLKIIYTVHGFHFYTGSPKLYWLMYYPMEKWLAKFTDAILTMNEADFKLLQKRNFGSNAHFKIPGVGINISKFQNIETNKSVLRNKLGYSISSVILLYIAEFIPRKNHKFILDSIPLLKAKMPDFKVLFAGRGALKAELEAYAKKIQVIDIVDFLGFRQDIGEIIYMSDIGISASKQEGLPMNVAEEMYSGLPVVGTNIRGHQDLIDHNINGFLFPIGNQKIFTAYIIELSENKDLYDKMSALAKEKARQFELGKALDAMSNIYQKYL